MSVLVTDPHRRCRACRHRGSYWPGGKCPLCHLPLHRPRDAPPVDSAPTTPEGMLWQARESYATGRCTLAELEEFVGLVLGGPWPLPGELVRVCAPVAWVELAHRQGVLWQFGSHLKVLA